MTKTEIEVLRYLTDREKHPLPSRMQKTGTWKGLTTSFLRHKNAFDNLKKAGLTFLSGERHNIWDITEKGRKVLAGQGG